NSQQSPPLSRNIQQSPPLSRNSQQRPPLSRNSQQSPPQSRNSQQSIPIPRMSQQSIPPSRTDEQSTPLSIMSQQSPPLSRYRSQTIPVSRMDQQSTSVTRMSQQSPHQSRNSQQSIPLQKYKESLQNYDWFVGQVTRQTISSHLLGLPCRDGSFVVRNSQTSDDIVISVREGDDVKHYIIRHNREGYFHVVASRSEYHPLFTSISELVQYYQENTFGNKGFKLTKALLQSPRRKSSSVWEVNPRHLTMLQTIKNGSFATVNKALWRLPGSEEENVVAVKIFFKDTSDMQSEFITTIKSMKKLRHPNLVRMFGFCAQGQQMIIMEYIYHEDLVTFLKQGFGSTFQPVQLLDLCHQVCNGMKYLESQKFIHRDLAARNVLIAEEFKAKISDFGIARVLQDEIYIKKTSFQFDVPFRWSAPEVIEKAEYSCKSDVWSFGILCWEVFSYGQLPFGECTTQSTVHGMLRDGMRLLRPQDCPHQVYNQIMLPCWAWSQLERPTFSQLYEEMQSRIFQMK
ncbi:unnamed protein product, partial [Meganyctiphanes norvegica]